MAEMPGMEQTMSKPLNRLLLLLADPDLVGQIRPSALLRLSPDTPHRATSRA